MGLFIVLWIAEALFAGLFIVTGHPHSTKTGFICKMIACALFMTNGLYAYSLSDRTAYGATILVGLALGCAGDVFLALDPFIRHKQNKKLNVFVLVFGGVLFLLGHVAYMIAFLRVLREAGAFPVLQFAAAWGGMLVCITLAVLASRIRLGKFLVPVAVYTLGISCMFALSLATAVRVYAGQPVMQAILIATPILFILSDYLLTIKIADRTRFGSLPLRIVYLCAYFIAQMLFGMTIYLAA